MFAQPRSRSALLAGLLTAALVVPAWSAEPEMPASERPAVLAASPQTGPVIAREVACHPDQRSLRRGGG